MLEFCKNGFLLLENVVPTAVNQRAVDFLNEHPTGEPIDILFEDRFMDNVILNPAAAGAVRSLLGKDFALPNLMSNHRTKTPARGAKLAS